MSKTFFPNDLSHLVVLETLKGSTNPEKVQDTASQQVFVKKRGANAKHCINEYDANQIYSRLGAPVPPMQKYEINNEVFLLTKFIQGTLWRDFQQTATPAQIQQVRNHAANHFVLDCLLANWDVIGSEDENIIIVEHDTLLPYRIDTGGALSYRAMGEKKQPFDWDNATDFVSEIFTMRDKQGGNANASNMFYQVSEAQIAVQVQELCNKQDLLFCNLNMHDAAIIQARLMTLKQTFVDNAQQQQPQFSYMNDDDADMQLALQLSLQDQ